MTTTEQLAELVARLLSIADSSPPFARQSGDDVGIVVNLLGAIEREAAQAILSLLSELKEAEGREALRDRTAKERDERIAELEAERLALRNETLEEAAKAVISAPVFGKKDNVHQDAKNIHTLDVCVKAIRALKQQRPT